MPTSTIRLRDVREHNLVGVDVEIPRGKLTVVTGVSGSGKSSLVLDTLHAASERRYLETLSAHARQFLQRTPSPKLAAASGLSPSIALSQRRSGDHARSTVGTLSGLHDLLRFWFARENGLEPRDLSFVTAGACDACRGLGHVDEVARELLVADPARTLREGALVPTTPTGSSKLTSTCASAGAVPQTQIGAPRWSTMWLEKTGASWTVASGACASAAQLSVTERGSIREPSAQSVMPSDRLRGATLRQGADRSGRWRRRDFGAPRPRRQAVRKIRCVRGVSAVGGRGIAA